MSKRACFYGCPGLCNVVCEKAGTCVQSLEVRRPPWRAGPLLFALGMGAAIATGIIWTLGLLVFGAFCRP